MIENRKIPKGYQKYVLPTHSIKITRAFTKVVIQVELRNILKTNWLDCSFMLQVLSKTILNGTFFRQCFSWDQYNLQSGIDQAKLSSTIDQAKMSSTIVQAKLSSSIQQFVVYASYL